MAEHRNSGEQAMKHSRSWPERLRLAQQTGRWVSGHYQNRVLIFQIGRRITRWRVGKKLVKEKCTSSNPTEPGLHDSTAIFKCTCLDENEYPVEAVPKLCMQIPNPGFAEGQTRAVSTTPDQVSTEIKALERITESKLEAPGPRLLATRFSRQGPNQWVTDGYVCGILMEKVPGATLNYDSFWALSVEQRNDVRLAFQKAYTTLSILRISHQDRALRNLVWDEEKQKVSIVDYQSAVFLRGKGPEPWDDWFYQLWGLRKYPFPETPHNGW